MCGWMDGWMVGVISVHLLCWGLTFLWNSVNRTCRSSKESSIQEQAYEMVDELNMALGNSRDPSLNKTTPSEANMERRSSEDLDSGGYSSLKRRSSVTFA